MRAAKGKQRSRESRSQRHDQHSIPVTRRRFCWQCSTTVAAVAIGSSPWTRDMAAQQVFSPRARADACIFVWLGGGACHIDTWDPKRKTPDGKQPGSYYEKIPTVVPGIEVCEHLRRMARLMDRCVIIRSVHHEVIDEHAAAVNRLHTGRPTASTTIYPSIGSVVAWELGGSDVVVPPYILMGYPSPSRGPGFLGARAGYLYLTDTECGPAGLRPPPELSPERQSRRKELLATVSRHFLAQEGHRPAVEDYQAVMERAERLCRGDFVGVFDLKTEPASLREAYGSEFGQRCLLARRLVESGVRFVEVSYNLNFINGTGWDTHNEGQLRQHELIQDLDQALAALIEDLERRNRLDRTLIVVATEFGRPPEFDSGGGRGHYSKAFSVLLAGGGLRTGQVVGVTDELGKTILERPVSVPDLHATIYAALGIDPSKELYDGDRPVPITDHGTPVEVLFA